MHGALWLLLLSVVGLVGGRDPWACVTDPVPSGVCNITGTATLLPTTLNPVVTLNYTTVNIVDANFSSGGCEDSTNGDPSTECRFRNLTIIVGGDLNIISSELHLASAAISVEGTLTLSADSKLSADAGGPRTVLNIGGQPTTQGYVFGGGGNGGSGATSCGSVSHAAAGQANQFAVKPFAFGGSSGEADKTRSRGGGRLFIVSGAAVSLAGNVTANGECLEEAGGGAGGSIYIEAPLVDFGPASTGFVIASGGSCANQVPTCTGRKCAAGGGGGGGYVSINAPTVTPLNSHTGIGNLNILVDGGPSSREACPSGAPGFALLPAQGSAACLGSAAAFYQVSPTTRTSSSHALPTEVKHLLLQGCHWAVTQWGLPLSVLSMDMSRSWLEVAPDQLTTLNGTLNLAGQSQLTCQTEEEFTLTPQSLTVSSSVIRAGLLRLIALDSVDLQADSYVHFAGSSTIAARRIEISSEVSQSDLPTELPILFLNASTVSLTSSGVISSDHVYIHATQSVSVSGSITARTQPKAPCNTLVSNMSTCALARGSQFQEYSLAIDAPVISVARIGTVRGSTVKLCTTALSVSGTLDASGTGCPAGTGFGAGTAASGMPGSGAGHGGEGGQGVSGSGISTAGKAYDDPDFPQSLGSGGGGDLGGPGGGFISVETTNLTMTSGLITASGLAGTDANPSASQPAGGGGSAGSILLSTNSMVGDSNSRIELEGGHGGSGPEGADAGGGGGGLLLFQVKEVPGSPFTLQFTGDVYFSGGAGGDDSSSPVTQGMPGQHFSDPPCQPGFGGGLCLPCRGGSYQANVSHVASCTKCPTGTFSSGAGSSSCTPCGDGMYQDRQGATQCLNCTEGTSSKTPHVLCLFCTAGYGANANRDGCVKCYSGGFSNATSPVTSPCKPCPPGSVSKEHGARSCQLCGVDTYNGRSAQSTCVPCTGATVTNGTGATHCIDCPAGSFKSTSSWTEHGAAWGTSLPPSCSLCDAGTFSLAGMTKCSPCDTGQVAYYNRTGCTACRNKPHHSEYTPSPSGEYLTECPYSCHSGYSATAACQSSMQVAMQGLGGWPVCGSVLAVLLLMLVVKALCGRAPAAPAKSRATEHTSLHGLSLSMMGTSGQQGGLAGDAAALGYAPLVDWGRPKRSGAAGGRTKPSRRKPSSKGMFGAESSLLPRHVHRVYLQGANSTPGSPFVMTGDIPPELEHMVDHDEFVDYAEEITDSAAPKPWKTRVYFVLWFLFYPLAMLWSSALRSMNLTQVLVVQEGYDHGFLRNARAQALRDCIKFGVSGCRTLAWLDILMPAVGVDTGGVPVGQPRVPMVLVCAGDGSFATPYRLELRDAMVLAGAQMLGECWMDIVVSLNDSLRTIRASEELVHSPGLRHVQSYITFAHESLHCQVFMQMGVINAGVDGSVGPASQLALILLPNNVATDGGVSVYLPHNTVPIRWRPATRERGLGLPNISGLSLLLRNVPKAGGSATVTCLLAALLLLDAALAAVLNSGLWELKRQYFWLVLFLWPLAWVVSPILGLVAVMWQSPLLARMYAAANLLSAVNVLVAIVTAAADNLDQHLGVFFIAVPLLWFGVKLAQSLITNIFVAHMEFDLDVESIQAAVESSEVDVPRPSPHLRAGFSMNADPIRETSDTFRVL